LDEIGSLFSLPAGVLFLLSPAGIGAGFSWIR